MKLKVMFSVFDFFIEVEKEDKKSFIHDFYVNFYFNTSERKNTREKALFTCYLRDFLNFLMFMNKAMV